MKRQSTSTHHVTHDLLFYSLSSPQRNKVAEQTCNGGSLSTTFHPTTRLPMASTHVLPPWRPTGDISLMRLISQGRYSINWWKVCICRTSILSRKRPNRGFFHRTEPNRILKLFLPNRTEPNLSTAPNFGTEPNRTEFFRETGLQIIVVFSDIKANYKTCTYAWV